MYKMREPFESLFKNPVCVLSVYMERLEKKYGIQIVRYPPFVDHEEQLVHLIFDLHHFPLNQVMERFTKNGGEIQPSQNVYKQRQTILGCVS